MGPTAMGPRSEQKIVVPPFAAVVQSEQESDSTQSEESSQRRGAREERDMTAPKFETLLLQENDVTLVVTINRPQALNALNAQVLRDLNGLLDWLETPDTRPHLKVLILTGAGEKAFVAGADIKEFEDLNPAEAVDLATRGQAICTRLERLRMPVIAAVNGFALGGGLELALGCDFIYASENAKFGLPECTLGLMPGYGGTVRLPRRIGPARAKELTFTGGMVSADDALKLGLVNKVLPQAQLLSACLETAQLISQRAPVAIAMIKRSIKEGLNLAEEKANQLEAGLFGELFTTEDKREGVRAFIEKRKPNFRGQSSPAVVSTSRLSGFSEPIDGEGQ